MNCSAALVWQVRQARVTAGPSPSLKGPFRILNLLWSAVWVRAFAACAAVKDPCPLGAGGAGSWAWTDRGNRTSRLTRH